jgi:hypothetical protein
MYQTGVFLGDCRSVLAPLFFAVFVFVGLAVVVITRPVHVALAWISGGFFGQIFRI